MAAPPPSDVDRPRARRTRVVARRLFWYGLIAVMLVVGVGFRYRAPADALCAQSLVNIANSANIARYAMTFQAPADVEDLAVYVGEALPFHRLIVNGADLTPEIDITARDRRDMAPQLHPLPREVVRTGHNVALLDLPVATELGPMRVSQVCVGARDTLESAFRANWWRMVGAPRVFALVLIVLGALALALWSLSGRQTVYTWYLACVLLLLERCLYVCVPYRPGGAQTWIALGNISIGMLPLALYRFMRAHWGFRVRGLDVALTLPIAAALLSAMRSALDPDAPQPAWDYVAFLGITLAVSIAMVAAVARRFRDVHWLEQGVAVWGGIVALFGSVLEIANLWLPLSARWTWAGPPCHTLLAMGLGYLLLRRVALGADLHASAARVLAQDFETEHDIADDTPDAWSDVSTSLLAQERRRLLRDIHDGFGSRLVMVLNRVRQELPDSNLQRQIHRALLDMRLMVDAMDPSSRSLAHALARFRARLEPVLEEAGLHSTWDVDSVADLRIDDRRRLVGILRCLEEFVDNAIRHARATTLDIGVHGSHGRLDISCRDDGLGLRPQDLGRGRGLLRASQRAELLGGSLSVGRLPGGGTLCTLAVPLP